LLDDKSLLWLLLLRRKALLLLDELLINQLLASQLSLCRSRGCVLLFHQVVECDTTPDQHDRA
jgi:hypothetical protein